jgi:hypothetical protein
VLPYTPHSCQPSQTINPTSTFFQNNQITKHQKMSPSIYSSWDSFTQPPSCVSLFTFFFYIYIIMRSCIMVEGDNLRRCQSKLRCIKTL